MSCEVQIEKISASTEGFTGADLQGLLYTARLQAVKAALKAPVEQQQEMMKKPLMSPSSTYYTFDRQTGAFLRLHHHQEQKKKNEVRKSGSYRDFRKYRIRK